MGAVARPHGHARTRRGLSRTTTRIPLSRPYLGEREEELVLDVLRSGRLSLGPTIGAVITILLAEILRIGFGTRAVGWDNLVYGVLLVLFIIFLPKGIVGSLRELRQTPRWTSS